MKILAVKYNLLVVGLLMAAAIVRISAAEVHPNMDDYKWWREARFGIFIHWGPESLMALGGGGWQRDANPKGEEASRSLTTPGKLPQEIADDSYLKYFGTYHDAVSTYIYDNIYQIFNPQRFNADDWVQTFKDAGAKYIVFTAKHHDGFCMFDSKYTNYDIMSTPYARDILKELTDACHKAGIKVILYYSKPDWSSSLYDPKNPKPYENYMINQVKELCSNYGEVKGFWWDGHNAVKVDGKRVSEAILDLQPGAIYNNRGGMNMPGQTFSTPEQKPGEYNRGWPWESCGTVLGEEWFWNGEHDVKSVKRCLKTLVSAAVGDGNLLLNFGPAPDGTIPPKVRLLYLGMGHWLKQYGESIYGTRGGPYKPGIWGGSTCKGNIVYLHIMQTWPKCELHLPKLPAKIIKSEAITGGKVQLVQTESELIVNLPEKFHNEYDTVIKLEIDKNAFKINPMDSENVEFISLNATVRASSEKIDWRGWAGAVVPRDFEVKMEKTKYFGESATTKPAGIRNFKPSEAMLKKYPWVKISRDHIWRFWRAQSDDSKPWLEVDFGKPKTFNKITILEKLDRIKYYKLQYKLSDKWITFYSATELSKLALALPKPITAQQVRLKIIYWNSDNCGEGVGIRRFDFWMDKNN